MNDEKNDKPHIRALIVQWCGGTTAMLKFQKGKCGMACWLAPNLKITLTFLLSCNK